MKTCIICKETKDIKDFTRYWNRIKNGTKSYYYRSFCKKCDYKKILKWRASHQLMYAISMKKHWTKKVTELKEKIKK